MVDGWINNNQTIMPTGPGNVDPYTPLLYSKIVVYRGIHAEFSYFFSKE